MVEVIYSVKYRVVLDLDDGENVDDKICDINIPEDGTSQYIDNSFEIVKIKWSPFKGRRICPYFPTLTQSGYNKVYEQVQISPVQNYYQARYQR